MKILDIKSVMSLTCQKHDSPLAFICLIHGKEYSTTAKNVEHMIEKILHQDKFTSREEVIMDIQLNYKSFLNENQIALPSATGDASNSADNK